MSSILKQAQKLSKSDKKKTAKLFSKLDITILPSKSAGTKTEVYAYEKRYVENSNKSNDGTSFSFNVGTSISTAKISENSEGNTNPRTIVSIDGKRLSITAQKITVIKEYIGTRDNEYSVPRDETSFKCGKSISLKSLIKKLK